MREPLKYLRTFSLLGEQIINSPDYLCEKISKFDDEYQQYVYPCNIIQLRPILMTETICHRECVVLFPYPLISDILSPYGVFLEINPDDVDTNYKIENNILVFDSPKISIGKGLKRIVVNAIRGEDRWNKVHDIATSEGCEVEILQSNRVPGISMAQNQDDLVKYAIKKNITLTPQEEKIFDVLRGTKREFNLPVNFRVAGGWVRDKLLNKNNDDIDIAVDMSGQDIANYVYQYALKYNIPGVKEPFQVSLIKDKSESEDELQVGAIYIYDMKIEFVPMRTEEYDEKSRTPKIIITNDPREDAKRRDLSINALYYNIETGKIEDYVGGVDDLENEEGYIILRTPDDPHKTFMEDPLRMLRVLRFHSRYPNSVVDPQIMQSMADPAIQQAYNVKVAQERAGQEILKMMSTNNPVEALRILFNTGLYKSVFNLDQTGEWHPDYIMMDQRTPYHTENLLGHTLNTIKFLNENINRLHGEETPEQQHMRGLMNLAALFHDFGKMSKGMATPHPDRPEQMQYLGHEQKSMSIANEILKSLGIGKDDRNIVNKVIGMHMRPHSAEQWSNKARAKFLRDMDIPGRDDLGNLWEYIFLHAEADDKASNVEQFDPVMRETQYEQMRQYIEKPPTPQKLLINGNDILSVIDLKPGSWIQEVINMVQNEQDEGNIKTRDEAMNYLNTIKGSIEQKYPTETKKMSTWYKREKIAQSLENIPEPQEDVVLGPRPAKIDFKVGDIVRDRRLGAVNPPLYGKVVAIKDNKMKIRWDKIKGEKENREQIFDLDKDLAALTAIIGKV